MYHSKWLWVLISSIILYFGCKNKSTFFIKFTYNLQLSVFKYVYNLQTNRRLWTGQKGFPVEYETSEQLLFFFLGAGAVFHGLLEDNKCQVFCL